MPPAPGSYVATFTVNSIPFGFDIRTQAYGEETEANVTVKAIPWSQTYTVVVQGAAATGGTIGSKPVTRSYRAIVYSEADYLSIRGQRGQVGQLFTPREQGPTQTGYPALLNTCKRAELQDQTSPTGVMTIELGFTMMA